MTEELPTPADRVSPTRLEQSFAAIAAIGALPGGGCERLAFSKEERVAHAEFRRQAEAAGLTTWVARIGNSFARLDPAPQNPPGAPGSPATPAAGSLSAAGSPASVDRGPEPGSAAKGVSSKGAPSESAPILTGSHLDTVAQGGCYDGAAGVLCSLEAVLALAEAQAAGKLRLTRPVEVVAWANEEGARFAPAMMGSAVYAGMMSLQEALGCRDSEATTVAEALAARTGAVDGRGAAGAAGPSLVSGKQSGARLPGPVPVAYLELHIEQGVELQEAGVSVAVVEGVQAQIAGDWNIRGRSAHAGATPMHRRADALLAAAELITTGRRIAERHAPGVATVGSLTVEPGSRNSVPGSTRGTVDLRHPEEHEVAAMAKEFVAAGEEAAANQGAAFSFSELWRAPRVTFDPTLREALQTAAEAAGIPTMPLFSAAGHDAVHLARVAPSAMLFVPSIGGVSHHPEEETPMADLLARARVLAQALGTLAAKTAE